MSKSEDDNQRLSDLMKQLEHLQKEFSQVLNDNNEVNNNPKTKNSTENKIENIRRKAQQDEYDEVDYSEYLNPQEKFDFNYQNLKEKFLKWWKKRRNKELCYL